MESVSMLSGKRKCVAQTLRSTLLNLSFLGKVSIEYAGPIDKLFQYSVEMQVH